MRAEQVIKSLLSGSSSVAAVVGARIYPGKLPQNTTMPAIAYEYVSGMEMPPIDAAAGQQLVRSRVQVNAMGKNYGDVKAVQEAVRLALLYRSGVIAGVTVLSITRDVIGPDSRDDELALYLQPVDYMVLHYES